MLKSILKTSLLGLMMVFAVTAYAADQQQPIQIEADNMKYFGEKQMSRFTGNVVVIKGEMKITSETMEVFFNKDKEVKEIFSKGNVRIEKEGLLALSGEARVFQDEQKAVLTEKARVWQGDNYLEGEKVTVFLDSDKLFVDKGDDENERVKIIITPKEEAK